MSLRSANPPRKRLLIHLSEAVETLSLRTAPSTHVVRLGGGLRGKVQVQSFEVTDSEFGHFEDISNALTRLDQRIYGKCQKCGNRIEEELLAEAPWATACLGCTRPE